MKNIGKQQLGARVPLLRFTEDSASPRVGSGLMGEGGSAACLTVLSTTTHGLFMGIDGMPRTHPSVLRAQVGER